MTYTLNTLAATELAPYLDDEVTSHAINESSGTVTFDLRDGVTVHADVYKQSINLLACRPGRQPWSFIDTDLGDFAPADVVPAVLAYEATLD